MSNPSASYLYRAANCPASQALPEVNINSADAARGTALHRYLERASVVGPEAALAEVPEQYRDAAEAIDLDGLPLGPGYRQEVTFRFDLVTGRAERMGCGLGRGSYERSDRYVYGTIDVEGAASVEDWKFEGCESHTAPLPGNPQMRFAALCKARVDGLASVEAVLWHIGPSGKPRAERATLDAFALDEFEAELRATVARVRRAEAVVAEGRTPDVKRGEWCRYCGAMPSCPAVVSLVRAVAAEPMRTAEEIRAALTPATARAAYQRLQEIKGALNPVQQALIMYASEFGIDLGDGRTYGSVETHREQIDGRKARAVLAEMFGADVAEAACDFDTSKAAIARALKPVAAAAKAKGEKVSQKALNEEALARIAAAGGVEEKVSRAVRVHRGGEVLDD